MSDYRRDVFPYRNDPHAFVNALLRGVPKAYTENVAMGYSGRRPGSGQVAPQELDRVRVRALLDAWNRHISDRYYDYHQIQNLDRAFDQSRGFDTEVRRARAIIQPNAPIGAVKFIYNELGNDPAIREARLSERGSYNRVYSAILQWCDAHCYGLVNYITNYLTRTAGAGGGNSALPIIYQAAWQCMHDCHQAGTGVYHRYFTARAVSSYFQPV